MVAEVVVTDCVSEAVVRLIDAKSQECKAKGTTFSLALSGGSLPKVLAQSDFTSTGHWFVLFADERCVQHQSPESTIGAFKQLFDRWNLRAEQVLAIDEHNLDAASAAKVYQSQLIARLGQSFSLSLALLGMGPDGHTCSLFPDHPLLNETKLLVAPIYDSPKPPPQRITLTLPVINSSEMIVFVAAGASKAPILTRLLGTAAHDDDNKKKKNGELHDDDDVNKLPCALVKPSLPNGKLIWIVDNDALPGGPRKDLSSL